jgi:acetyltransferase-like isoleucine patch superfamily enzyme
MGIKIGINTMISLGAKLDVRRGEISIGDNCYITWGSVILSHDAAQDIIGQPAKSERKTVIENNVFIGVNSVILPGVHIAKGSIIGSGSVVTKNVPEYSIVVGNPARIIRKLDSATNS